MHSATHCPSATVTRQRPWFERWWLDARDDLHAAWAAWRQRRRDEADLRALRALDGATLRDLGLEYLVARNPTTLTLRDREIGRW